MVEALIERSSPTSPMTESDLQNLREKRQKLIEQEKKGGVMPASVADERDAIDAELKDKYWDKLTPAEKSSIDPELWRKTRNSHE